jgi:hypothetical protein
MTNITGSKVMAVGFGLSPFGLGFFFPAVIPFGAGVLFVGALLVLFDK